MKNLIGNDLDLFFVVVVFELIVLRSFGNMSTVIWDNFNWKVRKSAKFQIFESFS